MTLHGDCYYLTVLFFLIFLPLMITTPTKGMVEAKGHFFCGHNLIPLALERNVVFSRADGDRVYPWVNSIPHRSLRLWNWMSEREGNVSIKSHRNTGCKQLVARQIGFNALPPPASMSFMIEPGNTKSVFWFYLTVKILLLSHPKLFWTLIRAELSSVLKVTDQHAWTSSNWLE